MEKEHGAQVVEGKPITVTVAVMGGAETSEKELPLGSTVEDALNASGNSAVAAAVRAGRAHQLMVRGEKVNLDYALMDGDNLIVTSNVKGGH